MTSRVCRKCGSDLPLTEEYFYRCTKKNGQPHLHPDSGFFFTCRKCVQARQIERKAEMRAQAKAQNKPIRRRGICLASQLSQALNDAAALQNQPLTDDIRSRMKLAQIRITALLKLVEKQDAARAETQRLREEPYTVEVLRSPEVQQAIAQKLYDIKNRQQGEADAKTNSQSAGA